MVGFQWPRRPNQVGVSLIRVAAENYFHMGRIGILLVSRVFGENPVDINNLMLSHCHILYSVVLDDLLSPLPYC